MDSLDCCGAKIESANVAGSGAAAQGDGDRYGIVFGRSGCVVCEFDAQEPGPAPKCEDCWVNANV